VDDASDGDTVEVRAGEYDESVTVNASITIRGPEATLDGSGLGSSAGIVIQGGGPTVVDLTVRGIGFGGVVATGDGDWTVAGVTAANSGESGIDAFGADGDRTVTDTTLRDDGFAGLTVDATGRWRVADSTVRNNGLNVILTGSNWTVHGGQLSGNVDDGLSAGGNTGSWRVEGTVLAGNDENGVEVGLTEGDWRPAGATITDSGRYGVTADRSNGSRIVRDTAITGSETGVRATLADGDWRLRDLSIRAGIVGLFAAGSDGDWSARGVEDHGRPPDGSTPAATAPSVSLMWPNCSRRSEPRGPLTPPDGPGPCRMGDRPPGPVAPPSRRLPGRPDSRLEGLAGPGLDTRRRRG